MRITALVAGVVSVLLWGAVSAVAATYYWDNNGTNTGFGTAGGTWDNSAGSANWNTNSAGDAGLFVNNPTATDNLNFGTATAGKGLAAGTITVGSATSSNITFGSQSGAITLSGGTISLADSVTITVNNSTDEIASMLSGAASNVTKAGSGTLVLSGSNNYSGSTKLSAGKLKLGANNTLPTSGTLDITANGVILDLAGVSQTINRMTLGAFYASTVVTGQTGTLTVDGSSVSWNTAPGAATYNLDISGLGSFVYTNAAGTFLAGTTRDGGILNFALASNTSFTASSVTVAGPALGAVNNWIMGKRTSISSDTLNVGDIDKSSTLRFSAVSNPTLILRGAGGGNSRLTTMAVGKFSNAGFGGTNSSSGTLDLTTNPGTLDAMVGTLSIGVGQTANNSPRMTSGLVQIGVGTLDATSILVGKSTHTSGGSGTLSIEGGTVKVGTLTIADRPSSTGINSGTVLLGNAAAAGTLNAQTITNGAGTIGATLTRNFFWNNGMIGNYDANTNLAISGALTLTLTNAAGLHAFMIDAGRTGSVNSVIAEAEAGCGLVKSGAGLLILATNNSYSGLTTVSNGTLLVNGSVTGAVTVASGGMIGGTGTVAGSVTNMGAAVATINGSSGAASLLTVSGVLVLLPSSQLVLSSGSDLSTSVSNNYDIIRFTPGLRAGQFGSKILPSGWTVKYDDAAGYVKVARGSDAGMMLMVK